MQPPERVRPPPKGVMTRGLRGAALSGLDRLKPIS